MLYSADAIVTLHRGILENGTIRVVDRKITDVGKRANLQSKYSSDEEIVLENTVLMPGLVNAHTHLEDGSLRQLIEPSDSFYSFLQQYASVQSHLTEGHFLNAVHLGVLECLNRGTTMVMDISRSGASFKMLFNEPIRSMVFLEFEGREEATMENTFASTLTKAEGFLANDLANWGVCPHSVYETGEELFQRCLKYADEQNVFVTTHAAESREEFDWFTTGDSPLNDYAGEHPHSAFRKTVEGPMTHLLSRNLIPPRSIIVHGHFVSDKELDRLAQLDVSVVVCPRSFLRFQHGPFPLNRYRQKGVNVCLGTEGLAATESLDMFEEMYYLKKLVPDLTSEEVLLMATQGGARAVGLGGVLGQIRPGFLADIIGLERKSAQGDTMLDDLLDEDHDVKFVMVNGKVVLI
jgi:cytosine/adenosine deaminase-related metal-dependent hydrolase